MSKKICLGIILVFSLLFTGCDNSNNKKEEVMTKDVEIVDRSNNYYNEQTLVIPINNGYRYTNVVKEFNEDTQEYTITITVCKPIKDE